ncbi:MAG: hypothetical protein DCF24_14085 [Cyanobium sp.]|nr:MAG: hypothetical protein DCF24_14085 [Cyanobium sp.]PZV01056.1 MAG: hypothetical protein DCF23_13700 [Cyanobium sp.]
MELRQAAAPALLKELALAPINLCQEIRIVQYWYAGDFAGSEPLQRGLQHLLRRHDDPAWKGMRIDAIVFMTFSVHNTWTECLSTNSRAEKLTRQDLAEPIDRFFAASDAALLSNESVARDPLKGSR